jgi:hypothetical protein
MPIEITFTLTEKDHLRAQWLHMRPRLVFKVLLVLLLLLVAGALLFLRTGDPLEETGPLLTIGVAGGFLLFCYALLPLKWRRLYRNNAFLRREQTFSFDEEALQARSSSGEGRMKWEDLHKWKEGKEVLLIYPAPNLMYVIPTSAFQDEEQRAGIRDLLIRKLGRTNA